jgi:hypothetical protein
VDGWVNCIGSTGTGSASALGGTAGSSTSASGKSLGAKTIGTGDNYGLWVAFLAACVALGCLVRWTCTGAQLVMCGMKLELHIIRFGWIEDTYE